MADNWYNFSTNGLLGQGIKSARSSLKSGREALNNAVATLAEMKDAGVVGTTIQEQLGTATLEEAEDIVAELESIQFKLNTNDSQSNLNAAYNQFLARFGP